MTGKKEKSKDKKEKRRQEISLLRTIPYSDHQRYIFLLLITLIIHVEKLIKY